MRIGIKLEPVAKTNIYLRQNKDVCVSSKFVYFTELHCLLPKVHQRWVNIMDWTQLASSKAAVHGYGCY